MQTNNIHIVPIRLRLDLTVKLKDLGRRHPVVVVIPHICAVCRIIIVCILLREF
jgi:hypothetical protein